MRSINIRLENIIKFGVFHNQLTKFSFLQTGNLLFHWILESPEYIFRVN